MHHQVRYMSCVQKAGVCMHVLNQGDTASSHDLHTFAAVLPAQVMEPVRSRCLCVRVPGPSHAQIQKQLSLVARKEGLSVPVGLGERVALLSQRNLRRALLTLEVAYVQHGGLDEATKVQPPDWELYCMVSGGMLDVLHGERG